MLDFERQHAELARLEVENTDKASPAGHRASSAKRERCDNVISVALSAEPRQVVRKDGC
jgi:hypothetical protein